MSAADYPVGTVYHDRNNRVCTIVDRLTTTNLAGEVVRVRYVATHEFMGQTVTDRDVTPLEVMRARYAEQMASR